MPGHFAFPLVAAGIDWLETLLPLLFMVLWIVSQVVGVLRKVAGGGPAAQPAARPPRPRPEALGDDVRRDLERQIGEFLGRAPGDRQPAPVAPRANRPRAKPMDRGARPAPPPPLPPTRRGTTAGQPLGSLGNVGDDVARHVHDAFAHEVGHLAAPRAGGQHAPAPLVITAESAAAELATALRSPTTIRQIVLLKEVLERPVSRW